MNNVNGNGTALRRCRQPGHMKAFGRTRYLEESEQTFDFTIISLVFSTFWDEV